MVMDVLMTRCTQIHCRPIRSTLGAQLPMMLVGGRPIAADFTEHAHAASPFLPIRERRKNRPTLGVNPEAPLEQPPPRSCDRPRDRESKRAWLCGVCSESHSR